MEFSMPSLLLPTLTGTFLVFAGILIGYFLWFRDRSEEQQQQAHLAVENDRLLLQLAEQQSIRAELEERISKQTGKLNTLQELCDELVAGREMSCQEQSRLKADVTAMSRHLDEARARLSEESARRAQLEHDHQELTKQHLEKIAGQETEWRERHLKAESRLAHRELEVQQLSESRKQEFVTLESSLRSQIELLQELRGQTAAILSAKDFSEESLQLLRQQLEQYRRRVDQLENTAVEADSLRIRCLALEQNQVGCESRIEKLSSERDYAIAAEKNAAMMIRGLQKRSANQEMTIRDLREKLELTQQDCARRLAEVTDNLRVSTEQYREQFSMRMELEEKIRLSQNESRAQSADFEATTRRLVDERHELSVRLASAEQQIVDLHSRLEQRTAELGDRHRKGCIVESELRQRLEDSDASCAQSSDELIKARHELDQAEARLSEFEVHIPLMQATVQEQTARIGHLTQQRDSALTKVRELEEQVIRLESHSKANEETIRALRRERGAVLLRGRQNQSAILRIHAASGAERRSTLDDEYRGRDRFDDARGWVFVERPQLRDDLKKIAGIADVLERKLNELGVFTFRQIMEWDQKMIAEFSQLFAFKDRIQRDGWQRQARDLYFQTRKHVA
jgi:predicted flap endonuclease-1-like 5' DNA nuclease/chromosome segregation ATPase